MVDRQLREWRAADDVRDLLTARVVDVDHLAADAELPDAISDLAGETEERTFFRVGGRVDLLGKLAPGSLRRWFGESVLGCLV